MPFGWMEMAMLEENGMKPLYDYMNDWIKKISMDFSKKKGTFPLLYWYFLFELRSWSKHQQTVFRIV